MTQSINYRRVGIILVIAMAAALAGAWFGGLFPRRGALPPANAIMVIVPYRYAGTWVFDDSRAGLAREPFVAGVPEMIDDLVAGIPGATNGFRLTFSARPFPGYQKSWSGCGAMTAAITTSWKAPRRKGGCVRPCSTITKRLRKNCM